ncbi:MAG: hypothetical protein WC703_11035 [Candidatus Neomarinimicrobiota bacterium]
MDKDFFLIGIDGGATKVNGWSIDVLDDGKSFAFGEFNAVKSYREIPGYIENFKPVDINIQLAGLAAGNIVPTEEELTQGKTYTQAVAQIIENIVRKSGKIRVLIGVGMPGLKTKDERGIGAMANGPRIVRYAEDIEAMLQIAGIELAEPISHIGSDAYYCGLGEEYAADGQFRNAENSYYLGGGTGAADAVKLRGEVVALDRIKDWFVKAWEMKSDEGRSVEKYVSSRGIQSIYADAVQKDITQIEEQKIYPPQIRDRALAGEPAACDVFRTLSSHIAVLLYERITTLYSGWQGLFQFVNPNRAIPSKTHPYHKSLLDSLIIGQRLGDLFDECRDDDLLWNPMMRQLSGLIAESTCLDEPAKRHYLANGRFRTELFKISKLREAPAIGAGIDAFLKRRN